MHFRTTTSYSTVCMACIMIYLKLWLTCQRFHMHALHGLNIHCIYTHMTMLTANFPAGSISSTMKTNCVPASFSPDSQPPVATSCTSPRESSTTNIQSSSKTFQAVWPFLEGPHDQARCHTQPSGATVRTLNSAGVIPTVKSTKYSSILPLAMYLLEQRSDSVHDMHMDVSN